MKIGLTGSIACGKSTVSAYLASLGCAIVDADAISRALTADGGAALPAVRQAFGDSVFRGKSLDRRALGQLVFSDSQKRDELNAILHPLILREITRQLDAFDAPERLVIGDIPLLYECGMQTLFDAVWVVSVPRGNTDSATCSARRARRTQAERRIDAQMPLAQKEQLADAVIHTDGTIEQTQRQIDALLCRLAQRRKP